MRSGTRLLAWLAATGLLGATARAEHHPHQVLLHHHLIPPSAWQHDSHIPYVRQWPHPGPLDAWQYGVTSPYPGPPEATPHYYAYPPYMTFNTGIGGSMATYPYPVYPPIVPVTAGYVGWVEGW